MKKLTVYCADVGSIGSDNFGWVKTEDGSHYQKGMEIEDLATSVADALDNGRRVALGFECPLFVPLRKKPQKLTSAREGEASKPWSAAAGASVLTTGLVQVAWTLRKIRCEVEENSRAALVQEGFDGNGDGGGLHLWEAFVSSRSSSDQSDKEETEKDHIEDAKSAAEAFWEKVSSGSVSTDVGLENGENGSEAYSLVGAALLRTGWRDKPSVLGETCLVVRAWKGGR